VPAFVVYAKRPSFVTTIQQAAASVSTTDELIGDQVPLMGPAYDETALATASETTSVPVLVKLNPNGVEPAEAVWTGAPATPFWSTAYVMILLVAFSVTTRDLPPGAKEISAGPELLVLSGLIEPAIGDRSPAGEIWKPAMLPLPPAFSKYSRFCENVTLIGVVAPDGTRSVSDSDPSLLTLKRETSLLPALTTARRFPFWSRMMPPWLPSPAPVPAPPVAKEPAAVSEPSAARANARTALPAALFVAV
jgi:hypothetical protein